MHIQLYSNKQKGGGSSQERDAKWRQQGGEGGQVLRLGGLAGFAPGVRIKGAKDGSQGRRPRGLPGAQMDIRTKGGYSVPGSLIKEGCLHILPPNGHKGPNPREDTVQTLGLGDY